MPIPKRNKEVILDNNQPDVNFNNNTVIDGHADNDISRYIKYIDGKILELDYYSFIKGGNGENSLIDIANEEQGYEKVTNLQLTLTSPITTGNYNDVSFEATLNANIVPAENDLMVLRLIDGRLGMFRVSEIDKRTYIAKKIYDIKGAFLYYSDANQEYFTSLYSKVKKTYIYDKTHMMNNSAPVILESKYKAKTLMMDNFHSLLDSYLDTFIHLKVLSVEYNGLYYFDFNIQKLVTTLIDEHHLRLLKNIDSDYDARRSIVDLIIDPRMSLNKITNKYYVVSNVRSDIALSSTIALISASITNSSIVTNEVDDNYFLDITSPVNLNIPNMFRTSVNNQYLFSDTFYENNTLEKDENYSKLEYLLDSYLESKSLDLSMLEELADDIPNWKSIEQYHYTPFVLLLMRYAIINTYSRI